MKLNKNIFSENFKTKASKFITFLVRYRYIITILAFIVYILFLDQTSLLYQYKQRKEINAIESELQTYKNNTAINELRIKELKTDKKNVERLAREKYYFKKENEDVFVIIDNSEK